MRLLAQIVASCFAFCVFLLPFSAFGANLDSIIDVTVGGFTIHNDDIVSRSDFSSVSQTWSFHFTWPTAVQNARAKFLVFRGTFGDVEGEVRSDGINYAVTNQAWSDTESFISKSIGLPALGDYTTSPGTYTVLIADSDNTDGLIEWFFSGGNTGVAPTDYATLSFYYSAEDEPTELNGNVESLIYRNFEITDAAELYRDDLPAQDVSPNNLDQYWRVKFNWPNSVPNQRALFVLFRGTFGAVDGAGVEEGVNYAHTFQAWGEGANDIGKYFDLPVLKASTTPSGAYSLVVAERDPKNTGTVSAGEALWFYSGGTDGVAPKAYSILTFDFKGDRPPPCCSSVLFLPGIKGSRLYFIDPEKGNTENQIWEPSFNDGNDDVKKMFLDSSGKSLNDVYVKKEGILDSVFLNNYYASFINDMNGLQSAGTISNWRAVAYDWRLSIKDILNGGTEIDGKIYYGMATSTPYISQTLRELAQQSKTGKVTIVAHSNGGLVTKVLMEQLGDVEAQNLIDKIIFIGVPQSGAPQSIGALLYGYKEGIPNFYPFIVKASTAREFAENSPMSYHLLPSQRYFDDTKDINHPVVIFKDDSSYEIERTAYGPLIGNSVELRDFLLANEGGRTKPPVNEINTANILNPTLMSYAELLHSSLDVWVSPPNISLYQIAGWGVGTVAGVEFYDQCILLICTKKYRPLFVEDGDGVVTVPSALMTSTSTENVKRYWLDLREYNSGHKDDPSDHGTILKVSELRQFIKNVFDETNILTDYVKTEQPSVVEKTKKLRFFLHSPLTLEIYDSLGNHVGQNEDGSFDQNIPDVEYGEFGDVQYISTPQGPQYQLILNGLDSGVFSLDIQEVEGGDVIKQSTLSNIPTTKKTKVTLSIGDGIETASPLEVDEDGDGVVDISLQALAGEITIYEKPIVPTEIQVETPTKVGGGGPIWNDPIGIVAGTSTIAIFSEPTTTLTHTIATSAEIFQIMPTKNKDAPTKEIKKRPVQKIQVTRQTASALNSVSQQRGFLHFIREVYNSLWNSFKILIPSF